MMVQKLTKQQAAILTGFTGLMHGQFSDFHADVEERFDRPIFTHEFASAFFKDAIKEVYREDFMAMQPEDE